MILDTFDYIVPAVHRSDRKKGFLALILDLHLGTGASIEILPKFRVCPRCAIVINMGKSWLVGKEFSSSRAETTLGKKMIIFDMIFRAAASYIAKL